MHYAGARYYMSALGRWISTDPILREQSPAKLLEESSRLLAVSPYDYVFGNPVRLRDPDGRAPCCFPMLATPESIKLAYSTVGSLIDAVGLGASPANAPGPGDPQVGGSRPITEATTVEQIGIGLTITGGVLGSRAGGRLLSESIEGISKVARSFKVYSNQGGQLIRSTRLRTGVQVRVKTSHGYRRHDLTGHLGASGLSVDEIETSIVNHIESAGTNGLPKVTSEGFEGAVDRTISVQGQQITYRAAILEDGTVEVASYFPSKE